MKDQCARRNLLLTWHRRSTRASLGHYLQAELCLQVNAYLTIFNLLAAISVLFVANSLNFSAISPLLSLAGLTVVLSTALQYVLKLEERSYDHKTAGGEFAAIKRKIEIILVRGNIKISQLDEIANQHDHASNSHYLVRRAIWKKIETRSRDAEQENRQFYQSLQSAATKSDNTAGPIHRASDGSKVSNNSPQIIDYLQLNSCD